MVFSCVESNSSFKLFWSQISPEIRVFPRLFTHGEIYPPPHMGGQVQGDKALMGGLMRGHRPNGVDLTLIDYIIN